MNRKKIIALVILIVIIAVLFAGWWIFLREDASKPEQEILFLYTMSSYTKTGLKSARTRIIDRDGVEYVTEGVPFEELNKVFYEDVILDLSEYQTDDNYSEEDMRILYKLFNSWDFDNTEYELKRYDTICDFDRRNRLYLIKEGEEGKFSCYLLCQYAKETKCIENEKYREYINYLVRKNMFPAGYDIFE